MANPTLLKVNDVDFTDIISYEGYEFSEEDLHADGSGRNPLNGLMWFRVVASKRYVTITVRNLVPQARIAAFMAAIKANARVNKYTVFNPITNQTESFNGYINKRNIGIFNFYYNALGQTTAKLKSFPIQITEM